LIAWDEVYPQIMQIPQNENAEEQQMSKNNWLIQSLVRVTQPYASVR